MKSNNMLMPSWAKMPKPVQGLKPVPEPMTSNRTPPEAPDATLQGKPPAYPTSKVVPASAGGGSSSSADFIQADYLRSPSSITVTQQAPRSPRIHSQNLKNLPTTKGLSVAPFTVPGPPAPLVSSQPVPTESHARADPTLPDTQELRDVARQVSPAETITPAGHDDDLLSELLPPGSLDGQPTDGLGTAPDGSHPTMNARLQSPLQLQPSVPKKKPTLKSKTQGPFVVNFRGPDPNDIKQPASAKAKGKRKASVLNEGEDDEEEDGEFIGISCDDDEDVDEEVGPGGGMVDGAKRALKRPIALGTGPGQQYDPGETAGDPTHDNDKDPQLVALFNKGCARPNALPTYSVAAHVKIIRDTNCDTWIKTNPYSITPVTVPWQEEIRAECECSAMFPSLSHFVLTTKATIARGGQEDYCKFVDDIRDRFDRSAWPIRKALGRPCLMSAKIDQQLRWWMADPLTEYCLLPEEWKKGWYARLIRRIYEAFPDASPFHPMRDLLEKFGPHAVKIYNQAYKGYFAGAAYRARKIALELSQGSAMVKPSAASMRLCEDFILNRTRATGGHILYTSSDGVKDQVEKLVEKELDRLRKSAPPGQSVESQKAGVRQKIRAELYNKLSPKSKAPWVARSKELSLDESDPVVK